MWTQLLQWLEINRIGDLAGIAGFVLSVLTLIASGVGLAKSKSAAERAVAAALEARDTIRTFETAVEFAEAISLMEEIRRYHRQNQWDMLPERYAAIRKRLVALKAPSSKINGEHQILVQEALVNITNMQNQVERSLQNPSSLKSAKFNAVISADIDNLFSALSELKDAKIGG